MSSTKPMTSNLVNVMQKIVKASPRRAFWLALAVVCLSAVVVIPLARTRAAGPTTPTLVAAAADVPQTGSVPRPVSVLNSAAATRASFAPVPFTLGTCDTAGPIEIEASGGTPGPTAYATLKAAFDAINAGTHTGAISVEVCGNSTETASAVLNASGAGSASYAQIVMRPSGGVARTISGSVAGPLVDLNGADNVNINGQNTGGDALTIENTLSAATPSAIRFIADATSNTVQNCTIKSAETSTTLGTVFFSTGTTTGNDSNIITNNTITSSGSNFATNAIYSLGTSTAIDNGAIQITNNNIQDYFNAASATVGINVTATGNSAWTITGNKLFQSATRLYTTGNTHSGILVGTGQGYTISNNTIGYANSAGTGTTNMVGNSVALTGTFPSAYTTTGTATATRYIAINTTFTAAGTVSNIQNNTVAGFALYTSSGATTTNGIWCGIQVLAGNANIGTTTGNTIGTATDSIYTAGTTAGGLIAPIYATTVNTVTIQNNTIQNLDAMGTTASTSGSVNGINTAGTAGNFDISGNTIGNTTNPNLRMGTLLTGAALSNTGTTFGAGTGASVFQGILNSATGTITIGTVALPNTIRNASANSTSSSARVAGIQTSGGTNTIDSNSIFNLTTPSANTSTSSSPAAVGIHLSISGLTHTITRNTIRDISSTTASAVVTVDGIYIGSTPATTMSKNLIYNLTTTSTSATSSINGILLFNSSATQNIFNNMMRLGVGVGNNPIIRGVLDNTVSSSPTNIIHNSIYIDGTQGAATVNTACINKIVASTMTVTDNILWNNRASTGVPGANTGRHYGIWVTSGSVNPTSNYNDIYAPNNGGTIGRTSGNTDETTLAGWRTATSQDLNSFNADPQFIDATNATTPNLHIHPTNTTLIEGNGTLVGAPTDDFDGQTRSGLTPVDIGADAGNFAGVDLSPPVISYTALGNTTGTGDRTLNITVTDVTGVPTAGIGLPVIYYRKNALAYVNSQCSFVSGSSYTCPILSASLGGLVASDTVSYYVAAQDTSATPNVTTNPAAGAAGFTANPPAAATPPTTPNSYLIAVAYTGSITVGTGGTFASLTNTGGLFQALNAGVLTGNVTIDILSDLTGETGTVALNQWAEEGAGNYTLTIRPSGAPRSITGTGSGSLLIKINGADRVTIDGSTSGGTDRSLTLNNTNTATGTGTLFIASLGTGAGANNVTVKNCIIRAGSIGTTSIFTFAVFVGDTSGAAAGADNDNLTIQNNQIMKARTGIQAVGTAAGVLDNLNINGNLIGDNTPANSIGRVGMTVQVVNNTSIASNTVKNILLSGDTASNIGIQIVQSANSSVSQNTVTGISATGSSIVPQGITALTATTGLSIDRNIVDGVTSSSSIGPQGISVSTGVTGSSVTRNTVTNISYTGTGGYGGKGIEINTGSTTSNVTVANNFVSNIKGDGWSAGANILDTIMGIRVTGTTGGVNLYNNTVNLASGNFVGNTQPATVSAALYIASTATTLDVRNNILTNNLNNTAETDDKNYAFYSDAANTAFTNINYNDYFVTASTVSGPQVLGFLASDRLTLADIQTATGKDAQSISGNPLLTSATDLHIASGSPARNAGTTIATVTVDYDGDARPQESVYDIGADEYLPDVIAPVISYTPLSNIASVSDRTITVTASDSSGVNSMTVVWNNNGNAGTITNPCTLSSGTAQSGTWTCTILSGVGIPPMTNPGTVAYYVSADDSSANLANNPSGATFTGGTRNMFTVGTGGTIDVSTVNTFANLIVGDGFTFNGDASVTGTLTLAGGLLNTGNANTLTIACGASITGGGAANYITGNLREMMCAPGAFNFPVGTASGYSPVDANVTAVGGGGTDSLTVRAVGNYYGGAGETPSLNPTALQRYWDLNEGGSITADIKWTFLPGDVVGGGTNYRVTRVSGVNGTTFPNAVDCPGNPVASPCVNIAGNYFYMAGVSTFSKWTAGQQLAPTAVGASIGGRILDANGLPIAHALVVLSGGGLGAPVVVQTGPFGYYQFNDIAVGQLYVVTVRSGRHTFTEPSRAIDLSGNVANADFVANPAP